MNGPDKNGHEKPRFDLIPPVPLREVAQALTNGHVKHGEGDDLPNWIKGKSFASHKAALDRHVNAYWSGETYDEEGVHHMAAAAANALILMDMDLRHAGTRFDDRPPPIPDASENKPYPPIPG